MITATVKIEKPEITERKAIKALRKRVNVILAAASVQIERKVRKFLVKAIQDTPEYLSIGSGKLQVEFGLPDGRQRIDDILDLWARSIFIKITPVRIIKGQFRASLRVSAIQRDWKDVLSLPAARVITNKGQILPWLEWLLTAGSRIIVRDYDVVFTSKVRTSRTGRGIMVKGRSRRWRVPPEFSGTSRNNFVTRALKEVEPKITSIMKQEILRQTK